MTDNRTTELRRLLTERGIEWTGSRYSGVRHAEHTKWTTASGYHAKFTEYDDGQTALIVEAQSITPEQAIAATLGRPKAKSHPYGYERDTGCYDCTRCECGCINDISAKYCNDCGGEIEIDESAEKEIYHIPRNLVFAAKHDDGSLEFCERRYVPEDAATLGSVTCHMSFIDEYETASGEEEYLCECSECGSQTWEPAHDLPLYCRKCGKAVS